MIFNKHTLIATAVALVYAESVAAAAVAPVAAPTYAIPTSNFAWKNEYPSGTSLPVPKPEWIALVKEDPILHISPNALIGGMGGIIQNADPTGKNTYCNWTWDGCVKPTDIVHCKEKDIWGTSFDDGPYQITRELLAYFKSINVKVTFFVVGKQVITWPEVLKEAYDQGHEIGIHTWGHNELTTLSNEQIIGELKWTELAIKEVLGVTPRLMRPPRGDLDDRVRHIVSQLGYTPAMWSVDSQDWRITAGGQTEEGLLNDVRKWVEGLPNLTQGGNSLMHDLNNVTVGAALKSLPILHPAVKLSPVGVCAGWGTDASYQESPGAPGNAPAPSATPEAVTPEAVTPGAQPSPVTSGGSVNNSAKVKEENSAASLVKSPVTIVLGALAAFVAAF